MFWRFSKRRSNKFVLSKSVKKVGKPVFFIIVVLIAAMGI